MAVKQTAGAQGGAQGGGSQVVNVILKRSTALELYNALGIALSDGGGKKKKKGGKC